MINKDEYRLKIVTDGLKAENTFVYLDGVKMNFLQEFEINLNSDNFFIPVKTTFLPLPIDEVIFEDNDFEAEEKIAKFKNKLEIYTNGHLNNSFICLNGTILGCINSLKLYASANQENIELEIKQFHFEKEDVSLECNVVEKIVTLKDFISYKA